MRDTAGDGKAGGVVRGVPVRGAPPPLRAHGKLLLLANYPRCVGALYVRFVSWKNTILDHYPRCLQVGVFHGLCLVGVLARHQCVC